jgi:hypothetical protein
MGSGWELWLKSSAWYLVRSFQVPGTRTRYYLTLLILNVLVELGDRRGDEDVEPHETDHPDDKNRYE